MFRFICFSLLTLSGVQGGEVHALFTELLQAHVREGRVDYPGLCQDDRLDQYIDILGTIHPESIPDEKARLAYWLNAYNAFTLKVICQNYPIDSITDLHWGGRIIGFVFNRTVWDTASFSVGGEKISLNDIEHEVIRPRFDEPRIHFALVCAAISCPPLRSEAYEADRLDEQLQDQGRIFMNQREKNRYDLDRRQVHLSPIFKWFKDDFGSNEEERLRFAAHYFPEDIAAQIRGNAGKWDIKYTEYDWALND